MMVVVYHNLAPHKKITTTAVDGLLCAFLFATFVFGAVCAGQKTGSCAGPAKRGAWDNMRGCKRMTIAAGFAAANSACYATSTLLATMA